MAQIAPMTLDDIQHAIHLMYEGNVDYVASGDEDYSVRQGLINNWINRWANVEGMLWNELWKTTTANQYTFNSSTTSYNLPADFKFLGGFVRITPVGGGTPFKVRVYPPDQVQIVDSNAPYAYVTGIPGSYVLNLNGIPATYSGGAMNFDYYKLPLRLDNTTDIPEIPDPYFLVYGVTSQLHLNTRNNSGYTVNKTEAETRLSQMMERNMLQPSYQDNTMEDVNYELFGSGLGY